jgi:hypothetical protein
VKYPTVKADLEKVLKPGTVAVVHQTAVRLRIHEGKEPLTSTHWIEIVKAVADAAHDQGLTDAKRHDGDAEKVQLYHGALVRINDIIGEVFNADET